MDHPILFILIIFLNSYYFTDGSKGKEGINSNFPLHNFLIPPPPLPPLLPPPSISSSGEFLDPCEVYTYQVPCTEQEYEENEDDCLPQRTDSCNASKALICTSEGFCLGNCHHLKETYDIFKGQCFRKVGSDCRSPSNSSSVPPCEGNSLCLEGKCKCGEGFRFDYITGKCVVLAEFGQFCNKTIKCDEKSDITCQESQCQCKSVKTQYFDLKRKRCFVKIKEICSNGLKFCPDNSNCVKNLKSANNFRNTTDADTFTMADPRLVQRYEEKLANHRTEEEDEPFIGILEENEQDFVCKCAKGYGPTKDKRFCLGLHGTRCNENYRCLSDRGLKCFEDKCICEEGAVYSEQFETCITKINSSCGLEKEEICPLGATCKENMCTCDDLYTVLSHSFVNETTIAYSCVKSHGMECQDSSEDPFFIKCNQEAGLSCKDNKCICQNSQQFYDMTSGICKNLQNSRIPVVHFNPPDDREYNFYLKNQSQRTRYCLSLVLFMQFVYFKHSQ